MIDITSLSGTILQLVLDKTRDQILLSRTFAQVIDGVIVQSSTTNGVVGTFGQQMSFSGNSGSHRARVSVTIDMD